MVQVQIQTFTTSDSDKKKFFYITITSIKNILAFFNTSRQISKEFELDINKYNERVIKAMKTIGHDSYAIDSEKDLVFFYNDILKKEDIKKTFEDEFARELTIIVLK